MSMAAKSLPAIGLVRACEDPELLGKVPWFPAQLEVLAAVEQCRRTVVVAGRRSGKSRISAALLVWSALLRPQLRRYVTPDEWISFAACATSKDQGRIVLAACKQLVAGSPVLAGMVESEVSDALLFKNQSVIEVFPCSSRTTRGNPLGALALDELAFFTSVQDGEQAASEVHRALVPSLAQFGDDRRLLMCSSPNGSNFFKERYDAAVHQVAAAGEAGQRVSVAALKRATWEIRPDIGQETYDEERLTLGDEAFEAEFGGSFLAGVSALLSEADIRLCITLPGDLSPREIKGAVVGMDVGYRRDRSAAVVLGVDHLDESRLRVAAIRTWAPAQDLSQGTEAHAEMVLAGVAELALEYDAMVVGDTYESATTSARLQQHGVHVELSGSGGGVKGRMYRELAMRVRLGQIELPDHELLIAELRRLRVNYRGTSPSIENPRVGDSHGDVSEALARAVFQLSGDAGGSLPAAVPTTPVRPGAIAGTEDYRYGYDPDSFEAEDRARGAGGGGSDPYGFG